MMVGWCCTPCRAPGIATTATPQLLAATKASKSRSGCDSKLGIETSGDIGSRGSNIGIGFNAENDLPSARKSQKTATSDISPDVDIWAMPFQRSSSTRRSGRCGGPPPSKGWALIREKKATMVVLHRFLAPPPDEVDEETKLPTVSSANPPKVAMVVVRGPGWRWGDDDGGRGQPGTICAIDHEAGSVAVRWHDTLLYGFRYNFEVSCDLCVAPPGLAEPLPPEDRVPPDSPNSSPGNPSPRMGSKGSRQPLVAPKSLATTLAKGPGGCGDTSALRRQDSQADFAKPSQTIIVFDWDDTLFPTTYVRDDLNLSWRKPVEKQDMLTKEQKKEITGHLEKCERHAAQLLQLACTLGKVVLVTLARSPWVTECCKQFYPKIGKVVHENKVPIVYAQEGNQVDYNKQKMMSSDEVEMFWAGMKGKAIAKVVARFYNQYEGQSWKNIISIGDSDFERLGTFQATEQYMKFAKLDVSGDRKLDLREMMELWLKDKPHMSEGEARKLFNGADKNRDGHVDFEEYLDFIYAKPDVTQGTLGQQDPLGHSAKPKHTHEETTAEGRVFRVRTKTLKIMDEPTVEELEAQLPMMRKWLPQMVFLDGGFDFSLDELDNRTKIKEIEAALRNVRVKLDEKPSSKTPKAAEAKSGTFLAVDEKKGSKQQSSPRQGAASVKPLSLGVRLMNTAATKMGRNSFSSVKE